MNTSKLLIVTVTLFATLALYACAPFPFIGPGGPGGPGGMRLSADQRFTIADTNGDNILSRDEYERSLTR
ncbi:MAG: hypothetical protein WBM99_02970 [Psychromonas sp.]